MKKNLKFIPYLFVFLIGCSTSTSKIPKSEIAKEYGVNENINIQFYVMSAEIKSVLNL